MSEVPCDMCGRPAYTVYGGGLCDACKTKEKIREESERNEERRHKERLEAERERQEAEERRHEELMDLERERLEAEERESQRNQYEPEPTYSAPTQYVSPIVTPESTSSELVSRRENEEFDRNVFYFKFFLVLIAIPNLLLIYLHIYKPIIWAPTLAYKLMSFVRVLAYLIVAILNVMLLSYYFLITSKRKH